MPEYAVKLRRGIALLGVALLTVAMVAIAPAVPASAEYHTEADPGWAVEGGDVRALTRIGDTVYVGGMFTHVRAPDGTLTSQPHLAAFDAVTGDWDSTFTPAVDDIVRDLAPSADGSRLFVAGHFKFVNGFNRRGIVSLNPGTGAVNTAFHARVWGNGKAIEVDGHLVYLSGSFGKVNSGMPIPKLARFDVDTGTADPWWIPAPVPGPEGLSIPPSGGRLYVAGSKSLSGVTNPHRANVGAVDLVTGAPILSFRVVRDTTARAVDSTDDRVFVAHGGDNRMAVYDPATGGDIVVHSGDGDFQSVELIGRRAFVGSHSLVIGGINRKQIAAIDWLSGAVDLSFDTPVSGGRGVRAVYGAGSQLHLGGQITHVSNTPNPGAGFARLGIAPTEQAPSTPTGVTATAGPSSISLTWNPSTDDGAVTGYRVLKAGHQVAVSASTSFTDTHVVPGVTYAYEIEALDDNNNLSPTSPAATATVAGQPPTPPPPPVTLSPFVVTGAGGTYTAASQATTESHTGTLKEVVEVAANRLELYGGGTLQFAAGTFDLGADHFEFTDLQNVEFAGSGIDITYLTNQSNEAADTEPFDTRGSENVVVRDMTISAAGSPRTTSDAIDFDNGSNNLIERVKSTAARGRGIVFDGKGTGWSATGNQIRDCEIVDVPGDGIELLAADANIVTGCTITDVGGHGVQVTKASPSANQPNKQSNDNQVTDNTITNSGRDGVNINSSHRNQILDNVITNSADDVTSRDGIRLHSFHGVACDDNEVRDNVSTDNQTPKTQRFGLNISHANCNRTIVGVNDFTGNRVGEIRDWGTDTIYDYPVDETPPTAPTNVTAVAASHFEIDVAWDAATDDVGVAGYIVYRDGVAVSFGGPTQLSIRDSSAAPETTYDYTVVAFDAASNLSAPSSPPATVTTPAASGTVVLNPTQDSYVNANNPTTNYGNSAALRVDGTPNLTTYLQFDVEGVFGPPQQVLLRLHPETSSSAGIDVHALADNSWTELGINFANAPAPGAVLASTGAVTGGSYIEFDITGYVTANGPLSLAATTTGGTAIRMSARTTATPPELVVIL